MQEEQPFLETQIPLYYGEEWRREMEERPYLKIPRTIRDHSNRLDSRNDFFFFLK